LICKYSLYSYCKYITLYKLIKEYGTPDLIKIDVERGEYSVLSSLSKRSLEFDLNGRRK
jgi:FkbM family methyltransferase